MSRNPVVTSCHLEPFRKLIAQNLLRILSKKLDVIIGFVCKHHLTLHLVFVQSPCSERDKVDTTLVWCMCMQCACMCPSGFVWAITCKMMEWSLIEIVRAITSTFMHGFGNIMAYLFSLRSISAI